MTDSGEKYSAKVIVATHKKYEMPKDILYLPLHVGAEGKTDTNGKPLDLGFAKDNTGDNISYLNSGFCELTGLYWAWKNLNDDYIGLAHYRRHFSLKHKNGFDNVLTYQELYPYLGKIKIFVPKKRRYFIETLYSHYAHTHYAVHLDQTRKILLSKYPDYIKSYDHVTKQTWGYMFNMMIMEKNLLNDYCTWLFDILFELQKEVSTKDLDAFQSRFYGRVSEILFNVWLNYEVTIGTIHKNEIMEIPYIYMEPVNWRQKLISFLEAKFFNKKYNKSF